MDVMIDIETLGTEPNSIILTIGAVKFKRSGGTDSNKFYKRIDIPSCRKIGLVSNKETEEWWARQNEKVRFEALENKDNRIPIEQALKEFKTWFGTSRYVWSHGSCFDCVILGQAFKKCGMEAPWKFWDIRDTRTLYDLGKINRNDMPNAGAHDALNDCLSQIIGAQKAFEKLKK